MMLFPDRINTCKVFLYSLSPHHSLDRDAAPNDFRSNGRFAVIRDFMTFRGFKRNADEIAVDLIKEHNPAVLIADQDSLL